MSGSDNRFDNFLKASPGTNPASHSEGLLRLSGLMQPGVIIGAAITLCIVGWFALTKTVEVAVIDGDHIAEGTEEYTAAEPFFGRNGIMTECAPAAIPARKQNERCAALLPIDEAFLDQTLANAGPCNTRENNRISLRYFRSMSWEDIAGKLDCEPVHIASTPTYTKSFDSEEVRTGLLTIENRKKYDVGRIEFYVLPRKTAEGDDESRYFAIAYSPYREAEILWVSDNSTIDWGYVAPKPTVASNPTTRAEWSMSSISMSDSRWTDAAVALGRANASGCGEFYVKSSGIAYCWDAKQYWLINFNSRTARRM